MGNRKVAIWTITILGLGAVLASAWVAVRLYRNYRPLTLRAQSLSKTMTRGSNLQLLMWK